MSRIYLLGLLFLADCGSACPTIKTTRCNGQLVEVCGSNSKWQRVMDCSQIKVIKAGAPSAWTCAETAKGCTCVPKGGK